MEVFLKARGIWLPTTIVLLIALPMLNFPKTLIK